MGDARDHNPRPLRGQGSERDSSYLHVIRINPLKYGVDCIQRPTRLHPRGSIYAGVYGGSAS